LSGKNLKDVETYFSSISGLSKAQASVKPFWRSRMPNPDKITLAVENN